MVRFSKLEAGTVVPAFLMLSECYKYNPTLRMQRRSATIIDVRQTTHNRGLLLWLSIELLM